MPYITDLENPRFNVLVGKPIVYKAAQSHSCLSVSIFRSHSIFRPTRMNIKIGSIFKS